MNLGRVAKREVASESLGLLLGASLAIGFLVLAPPMGGSRAWWALAYSLILPALVAGRSDRRTNEGWLLVAASYPGLRRIRLLDWMFNSIHCFVYAAVVSPFALEGFLCSLAWSLLVVSSFELCEYRFFHPALAWIRFSALMAMFVLAPLIIGFWFNSTSMTPYVASYSAAVHPALCLMTAWSLPHLQDVVVYKGTLWSGSWVMPISWRFGAGIYFVLAVVSVGWFVLKPINPAVKKRIDT